MTQSGADLEPQAPVERDWVHSFVLIQGVIVLVALLTASGPAVCFYCGSLTHVLFECPYIFLFVYL